MPGKQARVLCPVCAEPMPPDETECANCGAFVIDEAVVRLSRAFGLDREKALKLFEAGFRHTKQLQDRDPNGVLEKGEVGLLFICTNCGGFVASGDMKCPRCAAEFEAEPTVEDTEEDILDLRLCLICGADNDPELEECEVCGGPLRETKEPSPVAARESPSRPQATATAPVNTVLDKVDEFIRDVRPTVSEVPRPPPVPVVASPKPPLASVTTAAIAPPKPAPAPRAEMPLPSRPPNPPPVLPKATPLRPEIKPTSSGEAAPPVTVGAETSGRARIAPSASPKVRRRLGISGRGSRKSTGLTTQARNRITAETAGGLVLAASTSLLLAGVLNQPFVSVGIAAFLIGLSLYLAAEYVRSESPGPPRFGGALLAAGSILAFSAVLLHGQPIDANVAVGLTLVSIPPFAGATRNLVGGRHRILLAIASAVPIIGQAIAAVADPTYALSLPWIAGIGAAMPWPAALATAEILRRNSASTLRRQLARAERDMGRKDYEQSLADYDRAIVTARPGVTGAEMPWYGKGATLILLGRYDEALRAIDRALDINPHNEVAWLNKGNAFTKLGRLIDALRCFNAAIKVNPA
ncbi:MAG TPA: tetratricopeptide repeat protein, partial [Thermoplasmata archaeon]|nr:tetratricopeptide repeat protein [Thermoplasmata archaeon]